jgi:hypothetical protein
MPRCLRALIIGAVLLGGCATPASSDPAPPSTGDAATAPSSRVAVTDPTPVPTAPSPTPVGDEPVQAGGDSVPFVAGSVLKTLADDGLRVRSAPSTDDDSYKYEPLLQLGTPLLLLDGPVSGSGYEWYEVAPLSEPTLPRGWVASGSRDGDAWLTTGDFPCPDAPTDMRSLLALAPAVGVLCFPNTPITVQARLHRCECDVDGPGFSPSWFSVGGGEMLVEPDRTTPPGSMDNALSLNLDPAGDHPDELPFGELVEVTGVFDHPAASSCTMTVDSGAPVPTQDCRFWFAVTRLAADH